MSGENVGRSPARRDFETLNGMRGVAAIAVVLFHGVSLVGPVATRGYLAVDLFFVLSGVVVAHAYQDRLLSSLDLKSFVLIRLIRFWPLYAIGLGLGLLRDVMLIASHNDYAMSTTSLVGAVLLGLMFLPFPISARGENLFPLNVPSWSLFFELAVNIIYAALVRRLSVLILVLIILASAIAFVLLSPPGDIGHVGVTIQSFVGGSVRTILSFSIGVLIRRGLPYVDRLPPTPVVIIFLLVAIGMAWPWGGLGYDFFFILIASPLLVMFGLRVEPVGRLAAISRWLGLISFPLYAIHWPILQLAKAMAPHLPLPVYITGWATVVFVILLASFANGFDVWARRRLVALLHPPLPNDPAKSAAP